MQHMTEERKFDDIRPYTDDEIPEAMSRIAGNDTFPLLASYVFPDIEMSAAREKIKSIRTIYEFQSEVMSRMNEQVIKRTMTGFTCGGIENLSPDKSYLFISNHRDIVLDSSLMQYVLFVNGHQTSEITFGANLMQSQLIVDIGRSNKMFKVERPGGSMKEFYRSSLYLSEYIRHAITVKRHSVWIAQRNGRTKDGRDITDQGVIKMLGMSGCDNKVDSLAGLNILPVSISYEWEPCDILKTLELYERRRIPNYIKKPGEDVNSIITGFAQQKGMVHLEFCKPLELHELKQYDPCTIGDFNRAVARMVDRRIHQAYRLRANNYIAHDMLYGRTEYADKYTAAQKNDFECRLGLLRRYEENCDMDELADIFLGIYANPVDSIDD